MTALTKSDLIFMQRFIAGCAGITSLFIGITTLLDVNSVYEVYAVEAANFLSTQQKLTGYAAICFALICLIFALFYPKLWFSRLSNKGEEKK